MPGSVTCARLRGIELLVDIANHEARAAAHFLIDTADILADDAEPHDADADQEIQDREQREHALRFRTDYQAADEQINHEQQAAGGDDHAEECEYLQRYDGKARHEIEVEANQVIEPVLRGP